MGRQVGWKPELEKNPWVKALIVLAVVTLGLHVSGQVWQLVTHFGDIIVIFFLAWFVAFIISPVTQQFQHAYRIPRAAAALVVYAILFVAIGLLVGLIVPRGVNQLIQLADYLPVYLERGWVHLVALQSDLEQVGIELNLTTLYQGQDLATQVERVASTLIDNTIALAGGVASVLFSSIIILVLSFYLVLDGGRLTRRFLAILPERFASEVRFVVDSINRTFGGFVRGTLLIAVLYGIGTSLITGAIGLGFAVLTGVVAGVLVILPVIGSFLAMLLPVGLAVLQGSLSKVIIVIVGLLALQMLVFHGIGPKVMGDKVGLHPVFVLFALLLGIKQAGVAGAVFGVPVVAVLYAITSYTMRRLAGASAAEAVESLEPYAEKKQEYVPIPWLQGWLGRSWRWCLERYQGIRMRLFTWRLVSRDGYLDASKIADRSDGDGANAVTPLPTPVEHTVD